MNDFVLKPIDAPLLRQALARWIGLRRGRPASGQRGWRVDAGVGGDQLQRVAHAGQMVGDAAPDQRAAVARAAGFDLRRREPRCAMPWSARAGLGLAGVAAEGEAQGDHVLAAALAGGGPLQPRR